MRKSAGLWLVGFLAALVSCAAVQGQATPTKPGPEHARLKQLVGTWETTLKSGDEESKGTATYKMELGGLWLVEEFKGEFGGAPFQGKGLSTYDTTKKKYVLFWFDSLSTSTLIAEGDYDKDSKTQTLVGEIPAPDGKKQKVTLTTKMTDDDTMVFTMRGPGPDGKEIEVIKVTYRRKK